MKTSGGLGNTTDFFRLFMAPGMGHCNGGPGPNVFDALSPLEQWVERGVAPETIRAAHVTNGAIDRTRPLCVYPLVASWNGTGAPMMRRILRARPQSRRRVRLEITSRARREIVKRGSKSDGGCVASSSGAY